MYFALIIALLIHSTCTKIVGFDCYEKKKTLGHILWELWEDELSMIVANTFSQGFPVKRKRYENSFATINIRSSFP
jgi:hypothetical protein